MTLAFENVKLGLPVRDHLMSFLQLTIVLGFVRFIALIESFSHLNLSFLDRELHLCLQLEQFILIFALSVVSLAPFHVQVILSLNLKFLNLSMVCFDEIFTSLDLSSHLILQILHFTLLALD